MTSPPETVTANLRVAGRTVQADGHVYLHLEPTFEEGDNAEWAFGNPALKLTMHVKPELASFYELGAEFAVRFTPTS